MEIVSREGGESCAGALTLKKKKRKKSTYDDGSKQNKCIIHLDFSIVRGYPPGPTKFLL